MDASSPSTNEFVQLLLYTSEFLPSVLLSAAHEGIDKTYKSGSKGRMQFFLNLYEKSLRHIIPQVTDLLLHRFVLLYCVAISETF